MTMKHWLALCLFPSMALLFQIPQTAVAQPGACSTGGMRSAASDEGRELTVVNAVGDRSADLYWVDFNGQWIHYATIRPHGRHVQPTFRGHVWISINSYGYCDIVFTVENNVEIVIK